MIKSSVRRFLPAVLLLLPGVILATTALAADTIYGDPVKPVVAEVLGVQVRTDDAEEMQYVILERLLDDYATQQKVTVTADEINAYIDTVQRGLDTERQQLREELDTIAQRLKLEAPGSDAYQDLLQRQQSLRSHLADLSDPEETDPAAVAEIRQARETIARSFIRQWKINRALYQQYGGRVIFQQLGPEPLDAYREFLESRQAQGAFKIVDADFETQFWQYFTDESRHSFYPDGSPDAQRAFEQPWWQDEQPQ